MTRIPSKTTIRHVEDRQVPAGVVAALDPMSGSLFSLVALLLVSATSAQAPTTTAATGVKKEKHERYTAHNLLVPLACILFDPANSIQRSLRPCLYALGNAVAPSPPSPSRSSRRRRSRSWSS